MLYVGHDVMHTLSSQEECVMIGLVYVIDAISEIFSVAHDLHALTPDKVINAQRRS